MRHCHWTSEEIKKALELLKQGYERSVIESKLNRGNKALYHLFSGHFEIAYGAAKNMLRTGKSIADVMAFNIPGGKSKSSIATSADYPTSNISIDAIKEAVREVIKEEIALRDAVRNLQAPQYNPSVISQSQPLVKKDKFWDNIGNYTKSNTVKS